MSWTDVRTAGLRTAAFAVTMGLLSAFLVTRFPLSAGLASFSSRAGTVVH
jgi:hypothetical protein